ncbi:MAG TPA: serpin family protein [Longimicrobiales bacterium]|nr:serpin family protein [Longimicrobiales bacterium]
MPQTNGSEGRGGRSGWRRGRVERRGGRSVRRVALGAALSVLAACASDQSHGPGDGEGPLTSLPRELSAGERSLISSANDFTFALLARAAATEDGPNLVLSPLSASMALGMLLNGATGETRAEMEEALRLAGLDPHDINAGYHDLVELLTGLDDDVAVDIANAVWARQGVPFEPTFLDTVVAYFDATVRTLDFADPASPDVINAWVREQTNDRIDEMVREIDPDAVMFLMNAIYFKGDWTWPFDPDRTQPRPFRRDDGSTVTVPMMDMDEAPHAFAQSDDGTKVLDLSYARRAWSMTFVQPPEGIGAMDFAASLDRASWDALVASLDSVDDVPVQMPRFTLEYERVLNDDLSALGMRRVFTDMAQLDALTPLSVYVHLVKQKAFIAVDEIGTEAAAVTSIEVRVVSLGPHIFLDRPFLFAIRERLTGTILFVGVVGDPA